MKKYLGISVVVFFMIFFMISLFAILVQIHSEHESLLKAKIRTLKVQTYEQGFFDGARTVSTVMTLDTNDGKWRLELTNLFNALTENERTNQYLQQPYEE